MSLSPRVRWARNCGLAPPSSCLAFRPTSWQSDTLESLLVARLPIRGLHPVVACALERFAASTEVREVVRQSGYSHRRFIALFRRAVERTFAARDASLADIALDVGYS